MSLSSLALSYFQKAFSDISASRSARLTKVGGEEGSSLHDWVGIGYVKRRQGVVGGGAAGQVPPERKGLQGGAEPWKCPPPAPVSSPFFSTKLLRFRIPQLEAHMKVRARVPYLVPSTPVSTCPPTPWPSWDSCRVSGPPVPAWGSPTPPHPYLTCPARTWAREDPSSGPHLAPSTLARASSRPGLHLYPSARFPGPGAIPGVQARCLCPGVQPAAELG